MQYAPFLWILRAQSAALPREALVFSNTCQLAALPKHTSGVINRQCYLALEDRFIAMACPLCACDEYRKSAFSSIYEEIEFRYVRCLRCASLYCSAMPDPEILQRMYGLNYECAFAEVTNGNVEDPKEPHRCLEWLRRVETG